MFSFILVIQHHAEFLDFCLIMVSRHFQQYFSHITAFSFTAGGSRSTQREPPTLGRWQALSRAMRVKYKPFLYGTNPGANSCHIGDRLQWSVQVCSNQLHRLLQAPEFLESTHVMSSISFSQPMCKFTPFYIWLNLLTRIILIPKILYNMYRLLHATFHIYLGFIIRPL